MPARGRRSAKPFTRRRSAAAFRLRPPVPRMNLSPNRGREDGAAVRPGPPGVVRLRPLLAGRQDLPGWGMAARSGAQWHIRRFAARSGATVCRHLFADVLLSASFYRRPFAEGLFQRPVPAPRFADTFLPTFFFRRPVPSGRRRFFLCPTERSALPPSRLCPLSSLPPLVSAPSRLRPLSALPRPRPVPVPVPFLSRSCPVPVPSPFCSYPVPALVSALVPVPVPFLSPSPLLAGRRFVAFFRSEG